ncbi:MAG TPA: ORF6N domain-containing protein [Kiritimatiellia bacterium]|nr:ORF6N domain-containing protein [Kiritimatiellia bacterium]HMO98600.1 ORF6N domain-containing protein [Kiritimatiellia bacterium]HMP95421.1 ORF6N domain-containing protein [Kiritimatiellia bacterium]
MKKALIPTEPVVTKILVMRGQKVLLDRDLAQWYGVETRALNQAVKRNQERFPVDFMFVLNRTEIRNISQIVICSETLKHAKSVYAFTEQGVAMLSGLLNSPRAVQVNIAIMRAFVRLRQLLASHEELSRKLDELEKKYDEQFAVVFKALRELMQPSEPPLRKPIGFGAREKRGVYQVRKRV